MDMVFAEHLQPGAMAGFNGFSPVSIGHPLHSIDVTADERDYAVRRGLRGFEV